jgi:CIC family chloride channel protein
MNNGAYLKMIGWRERHIQKKHFVLLLSFFVGIGAALAAVVLKETIHLIQNLLTSFFKEGEANYWYLAYPFIGIALASLFVHFVVKQIPMLASTQINLPLHVLIQKNA